jgi:hypothetical protein
MWKINSTQMKRRIGNIMRSSVVAVVNFCFLCGAGHLLDLGNYIFKTTAGHCQRWWHQLKRQ